MRYSMLGKDAVVAGWKTALVVAALLGAPPAVFGQTAGPANSPVAPFAVPNNAAASDQSNPAGQATPPAANPAAPNASNPANYASTPPIAKSTVSPQSRAAEQQSGLSQEQAQSLLQQKGYYRVEVRPDPGSVWVWQADAMKDGRPVQIGIDYRGNVLELSSSQAQPCTSPGVRLGITGGLGAGTQLQQADTCSGR
jgi:hypothetical protein